MKLKIKMKITSAFIILFLFVLMISNFLALTPFLAGQESHPCAEVYARCALLALSSNLSLGQTAEWLRSCEAMYISCTVFYYLALAL